MPQDETKRSPEAAPLVSIVTPFYNTDAYLAQCIESVLAQTYTNWEYILVNNQSTDNSRRIAERYAQRDSRIRIVDTPTLLSQVRNYEGALRHMSVDSRYCKMVQADDWIFPECVACMVEVAERNPTVGIVSSYQLFGEAIRGDGLPYPSVVVSGREICRRQLLFGDFYFGSPTSILIRADIIRATIPFFAEDALHADTEACYRLLSRHDMGFVHQVLSFSRTDNDSITSRAASFNPNAVDKYIIVRKYARQFLNDADYERCLHVASERYGRFLARSIFEFKGAAFWDYHREALRTAGFTFSNIGLPRYLLIELVDMIFNPKKTLGKYARLVKDRRSNARRVQPARGADDERSEALR
jgi:glycosyltransferase involved in cell wall biosynthesis